MSDPVPYIDEVLDPKTGVRYQIGKDPVTKAYVDTGLAGKADIVGGKVPADQLPSYVDDVLEFASRSAFPEEGEAGKIYIALDTGYSYRWSGSTYSITSTNPITKITYADLKALRDAGKLIPGQSYRITDYTCTTTQAGTQSAGHVFDIIVVADSESKLNESARAISHEGDTYFSACNLAAWKLQYCLDNDTDRFEWADAANGKGVIYRMIDEYGNECPYDFKNILFEGKHTFAMKNPINLSSSFVFTDGNTEGRFAGDVVGNKWVDSGDNTSFGNNYKR